MLQLLDHFSPLERLLTPMGVWQPLETVIVPVLTWMAPHAVFVFEAAVSVGLALSPRRWGILMTLFLHLAISMCPPPNNIAVFGVATCTRLAILLPDATVAAITDLTTDAGPGGIAFVLVAGITALTHARHPEGAYLDWAVPYLFLLSIIYARALGKD